MARKKPAEPNREKLFTVVIILVVIITVLVATMTLGPDESSPSAATNEAEQSEQPSSVAGEGEAVTGLAEEAVLDVTGTDFFVGVVSGHKGYDPGAVCDDGLTEADVNYMVAQEVVALLHRRGIRAEVLDEYDDRLADFQADALVSIHADSCAIPGATGFKVARVTDSAIPEAEDKLVACLYREYALHTGLPQHPASITDGMTNYHAFNQIDPYTPGAIIETGFLLDDRELLERRPKVVARGIAAGVLCFLHE